jgi:hypothetical protein|tara:strand:+ start:292 stop:579 length:288 start_codon:yes stop_codon:yes gene_type:complete
MGNVTGDEFVEVGLAIAIAVLGAIDGQGSEVHEFQPASEVVAVSVELVPLLFRSIPTITRSLAKPSQGQIGNGKVELDAAVHSADVCHGVVEIAR